MAELNKITSFQTFSQLRAQENEAKLAEEKVAKRAELAGKLASILDEMDITSFDELELEAKREFITKAFGNVSEEAEEVEEETEEPVEEGRAFIAAAKKAKEEGKEEFEFDGKTYPVLIKEEEEINEGKRENGKVVTAWKKLGTTDLNAIAKIYADAMEDANFHQEMSTSKAIGSASKVKSTDDYSNISVAAGWSGYAIANGTVQYLNYIGEEGAASKLLKAITKFDLNESTELPVSFELVTEGEREEQEAMELYTKVAGPEGAYSEDELAKGDDKLFMSIVTAAGHKGSKAKKIVDEFRKIATMESLVTEAKYDKKALLKAIKNLDDAMILVKGEEYIIYNPDNGNDDNAAMWGDKTIMALDQDGEEHEFKYSDIERFSESVVTEKKADGTISDDEDDRRAALMAEIESAMDQLLAKIKQDADDIGGSFRSPGIMYDAKKIIDTKLKKFK